MQENYKTVDKERFNYIDCLRGVAILMVILVHTSQSISDLSQKVKIVLSFGQMGVQLFFVLSSITLCFSFNNKEVKKNNLIHFYIKRFFRIAPLYYLGIILYFVVAILNKTIDVFFFKSVIVNIFFINDLIQEGHNDIVPGGWSIGTEMTYYLFFPLIYWITHLKGNKGFFVILILLTSSFLIVHFINDLFEKWFLYHSFINMLPVFLAGLFYNNYLLKNERNYLIDNSIILINGFLILLVISFYTFLYIDNITLIPLTVGVTSIFLIEIFKRYKWLHFSLLIRFGQLSYSIYLFHFIFAWYCTSFLDQFFLDYFNSPLISLICNLLLTLFLSFQVGRFSEKFLEKNGIRVGRYLIQNYF